MWLRRMFESLGEEGKSFLDYIDKKREAISSSKDPVILIEEG